MKISTRGRYATQAILDIAQQSKTGKPVSIRTIASRQGLSEDYLEQLLNKLKKAHLITRVRGKIGGYLLARAPFLISVKEVLEASGEELAPVYCLKNSTQCAKSASCPPRQCWQELYNEINNVLSKKTIADLIDSHG